MRNESLRATFEGKENRRVTVTVFRAGFTVRGEVEVVAAGFLRLRLDGGRWTQFLWRDITAAEFEE